MNYTVPGVGEGSATGLPGNIIKGGFNVVPEFPDTQAQFKTPPAPSALTAVAVTAVSALNADRNYCVSVQHPGTSVNKAVHAFKQAWNAANPGKPVPVGTGKYEPTVAAALTSLLGAGTAPDGCGAVAPPPPIVRHRPLVSPPIARHRPAPPSFVLPQPPPWSPSPAIVQVLLPPPEVDVDTTVAAPPVAVAPPAAPVVAVVPPPPVAVVPPPPAAPGEEKKGISTGALIAGGIGVAALIGIVAVSMGGGKSGRPEKAPAKASEASRRRGKKRR